QLWIAGRALGLVGRGSQISRRANHLQGNNLDLVDIGGSAANLYLRDARHHCRRLYRCQQVIGAGVAVIVDVRAVHVSQGREGNGKNDREDEEMSTHLSPLSKIW